MLMMSMQRITMPEIKKHPWFLKNLPIEFVEGEEANFQMRSADDYCTQSIEEAVAIIREARETGENPKTSSPFFDGSMDLDEISDADIEDVDTSGDFVCAL